jgi:nitrite reductase/ring-hydroxylating ferredoxin subunit
MSRDARWKEDFPVSAGDDAYATRRELLKFLGLTSVALFLGTCATAARRLWTDFKRSRTPALTIAQLEEIPVGGHKLFRFPTADDPCILLRLDAATFVAYEQRCTHLSCPVYFNAASRQLMCPCHKGAFSAVDGRPMAGPPKRSLTGFEVSVRNAQVRVRFRGMNYT